VTSLESLGLPDNTHQLSCAAPVLACLAALASEPQQLQQQLLACASNLSQCPLAQLYLLDKTHTGLHLSSQWFDGAPLQVDTGEEPTNWFDQQLLQYCLSQNRSLNLRALDNSLYATPFLPETVQPWRSLLCLPLHDANQQLAGLLLLARHQGDIAEALSEPLSHLGSIGLGRLSLLQQQRDLQHGQDDSIALPSTQAEYGSFGLIGQSPAMQQVYRLISKVLHNPVTVLIGGETGTGKELVARAIHDYGFRRSQAFIAQNCSALPEQLLESELFGYRKGAFTGAMQDRAGLFDAADGGTLFLDEIGDMPLALQAKLLRVLQEGEIRPLGSTRSHRVDVRIIAATHQRLHEQVQRGLFREDLYYRLGHFPIELPPLRERGSDIRQLALHFASDTCTFLQRSPCHWSDSALAYLASHRFPGNVRELKGLIARALLLCDGNLLLPEHLQLPGTPEHAHRLGLREQLEVVERNLLIEGLQLHGGNQTLTAQALGLPRRTLLYRMQRLGVTADTPK
tara:strand:+ start:4103 stop:5638 length:1536 start_codon:yes stop_codon:yes gene_type:complete